MFKKPQSKSIIVDFPEPVLPTIPIFFLFSIFKLMFVKPLFLFPGYLNVTFSNSISFSNLNL